VHSVQRPGFVSSGRHIREAPRRPKGGHAVAPGRTAAARGLEGEVEEGRWTAAGGSQTSSHLTIRHREVQDRLAADR